MPAPTNDAPPFERASLAEVTGENQTGDAIEVHFNPSTLQLQVSNELKDTTNDERKQYVAKTSAKLTMELIFDTTDTGDDATQTTRKLQAFVAPPLPEGDRARQQVPPPLVQFEWGALKFKGIIETYKETIDFFSADGVPLRSSVNLTLSRQDQVFDPAPAGEEQEAAQSDPGLFDAPAESASDAASKGNDPGAARKVAEANGQENLRFGDGNPLTVGANVELKPPAAFAGAGISGGFGLGGGLDVGGGLNIGGGLDLGAGASFGAGGAGIAGLAQLSATEGAFAGLRASPPAPRTIRLNTRALAPKPTAADLSTQAGAVFQVGGRARIDGPSGLKANVGANSRLSFNKS